MAYGQDNLNTAADFKLRDYQHAQRVFLTNGYENTPRYKFLFHVYFNINPAVLSSYKDLYSLTELRTLGLLVKNIDLPKFKIATDTLNQYNRKRIVQKKIDYEAVQLEMHDDGGDLVRNMWYNYFSYYYKDPTQQYGSPPAINGAMGVNATGAQGFSYNNRDIYAANRAVNDWGYIGEAYDDNNKSASGKPPFFSDISIYGFNQHKFVQYVLINPLISSWEHDKYDYKEEAGVMQNNISIQYETVKYYSGAIGAVRPDTNVRGFADPAYYDNIRSSISRPGSTSTVLGQGGLLDAGIGIVQDLQSGGVAGVIGAIQTAGTAYNTFKGADLRSIVNEEANLALKDVLRNSIPAAVRQQPGGNGGFVFPRDPAFVLGSQRGTQVITLRE